MTAVNYLWDPVEQNIVRELDDVGAVTAQYTTEPVLYGNLLSQRRGGQESYYHYDGQGSTLALTNANGDVTDTYDYSAFGEVTAQTGTTVNALQYIGQKQYYRDEETGECEIRRRSYNAKEARWLSADPSQLLSDLNGYRAFDNRPTMYRDDSGLQSCDAADPCAECNEVRAGVRPEDLVFQPLGGVGNPPTVCRATLKCEKDLGGLAGRTDPPVWNGKELAIGISLWCGITKESMKVVIAHELIHFKRFCKAKRGIRGCEECLHHEGAAYEESCKMLEPKLRARCKKCGIYFACQNYGTAGKVCARDETDPCTWSDIGIIVKS